MVPIAYPSKNSTRKKIVDGHSVGVSVGRSGEPLLDGVVSCERCSNAIYGILVRFMDELTELVIRGIFWATERGLL